MSVLNYKWKIKNTDEKMDLIPTLLASRGISKKDDFFNPTLENHLHDPFLMKDMEKSVEKTLEAIKNKDRIVIFGDYDADGITATSILVDTIQKLGGIVSYRLPHRIIDGYGLNEKFIKELSGLNVKLLITVDCGIACLKEVDMANEEGIEVIITDHHSIPTQLPKAFAIVHPKQNDCKYPFKELAGAGVAFKLAYALYQKGNPDLLIENLDKLLELVSIGTIADCVPIIEENRVLVKFGLSKIQNSRWPGLSLLKQNSGINQNTIIDSYSVSYRLAPRLNAAGRLDSPYYAVQLLLGEQEKKTKLAQKLEELNQKRQIMTLNALQQIENQEKGLDKREIIFAANSDWHIGIIGLIAGRLTERYFRPSFIMEVRKDKIFGSARCPQYYDLMEALKSQKDNLEEFGGHKQAAGFMLYKKNIEKFEKGLKKYTNSNFKNLNKIKKEILIDTEIKADNINLETFYEVEKFAPFGIQNEKPKFLLKNFHADDLKKVGNEGRHLKFIANIQGKKIDTIGFNFGKYMGTVQKANYLDMVCELSENTWNNNRNIQLKIEDLKAIE